MSDPAGTEEKDIRMREAEAKRIEDYIKKQVDLQIKTEDISSKTPPSADAKPDTSAIEELRKKVELLEKRELLNKLEDPELQEKYKDVSVEVLTGIIDYKNSLDPEKQEELKKQKKKKSQALPYFPKPTEEPGKDKGKKKPSIPGHIGGFDDEKEEWD